MSCSVTDDSPWELAKARFLASLDPNSNEKELFENATLENLYYTTSNADRDDSENSKRRAVVRQLVPLISAIESFGKAIDTFAQIAPLYLSPIWGCIRVILVVAKVYAKFYGRLVETLGRIETFCLDFVSLGSRWSVGRCHFADSIYSPGILPSLFASLKILIYCRRL